MASLIRRSIRYTCYPGMLALSLLACWQLQVAGTHTLLHTGGVVLIAALVLLLLEVVAPHSPRWRPVARSATLDVVHSLVAAGLITPLGRALLLSTVVVVAARSSQWLGSPIWPHDWPLPAQLALAILAADFGAYWGHRLMHLSQLGWRIHALHHTPEGLNVFAAGRTHPFNAVVIIGAETTMVLALGIPLPALALLTVYKAVNGLLQHANIDLEPGPLSRLLATSEVHRWHHSRVLEESNRNFGNGTMIWDQLFGTFFLPNGRRPSLDTGIEETDIPETYLAHLASPFLWSRYQRTPADQPTQSCIGDADTNANACTAERSESVRLSDTGPSMEMGSQ